MMLRRETWNSSAWQLVQPPLRLLPFGQVAHEAGEQSVLAEPGLAHRKLHGQRRPVLAQADPVRPIPMIRFSPVRR